jgi:pimeloyl-ACP methyl ester carboxylesterase
VAIADLLAEFAPHAETAVVRGAGHALRVEQPEAFAAALDALLARTTPRAP